MTSSDLLHDRLRRMRSRLMIRKWELRQIHHARGVWFRFEMLLAGTRRALVISDKEAATLRASGFEPHPVGGELEPPKALFVIPDEMLPAAIAGREIALHEAREILLAPALVLIPFRVS
jgi:hypothetical protein